MPATDPADVSKSIKPRWYAPTPAKYLMFVLLVQGFFLASTQYRWFEFNREKGYTVLIAVAATAFMSC